MEIKFWESPSGKRPPEKFFEKNCQPDIQLKITDKLDIISRNKFENIFKSLNIEKVKGYKNKPTIYELKIKHKNKTEYRLLLFFKNQIVHILEIFLKKSKQQMKKHFNIAFTRAEGIK